MFLFKKMLTPFLLPQGIFVIALITSGIWFLLKKSRAAGIFNIILGIALWLVSTVPVGDALMRGLESNLELPTAPRGDVIIILGGGIHSEVKDLTGEGVPSEDMLARIVTAVRLQKKLDIPVIISSGMVFPWEKSEAIIGKRFLVDLGVPASKIIVEDKSRDTIENARYSKELCEQYRFKKPLLVTSALHMKRAMLSFKKFSLDVTPFPVNLHKGKDRSYVWMDYIPGNQENAALSLREYMGLIFYRIAY